MKRMAGVCLAVVALFPIVAAAQRRGEAELEQCLWNVLGRGTPFDHVHRSTLDLGGDLGYAVLEARGSSIQDFESDGLKITDEGKGAGPEVVVKDRKGNKYKRKLYRVEQNDLKRCLALDPAWVICHVRDNLDRYAISTTDEGYLVFTYSERFLLSDPEEQVWGIYGEQLAIDPQSGEILEYGRQMKHSRNGMLVDAHYTYTKNQTSKSGGSWIVDVQGFAPGSRAQRHTVQY